MVEVAEPVVAHINSTSYYRRSNEHWKRKDASYYYGKRIGMLMTCMHDMTRHERCNLTKLNGTEIPTFNNSVQVIYIPIKLNVVSILKQDMGDLCKIKWNRALF